VATGEQHREISSQFLEHAEDEFRNGDLLQASEKAWETISHYVNSIARERNLPLGSHRQLIDNANKLISDDLSNAIHKRRLLRSSEALHANFYQSFLDEDSVDEGIQDAKELIRNLEVTNSDIWQGGSIRSGLPRLGVFQPPDLPNVQARAWVGSRIAKPYLEGGGIRRPCLPSECCGGKNLQIGVLTRCLRQT